MSEINTALVTGASSGIGRATALRLVDRGWRVLAGVRRSQDGKTLAAEAELTSSEGSLEHVLLDVTDVDQIAAVAARVHEVCGDDGLDGLVNNAGINVFGFVETATDEDWQRQFAVNLFGPVALTRALLPSLRVAGGRVVFTGSMAARAAAPGMGAYSASKAAVASLTETLRHELRPFGIGVTVVEPGMIRTAMSDKSDADLERVRDGLSEDEAWFYGSQIDKLIERAGLARRIAIPPSVVAAAIERVLTMPAPPGRLLVGADALAIGALGRILPDRAKDALVRLAT